MPKEPEWNVNDWAALAGGLVFALALLVWWLSSW
jgi:hypothetical protein